MFIKIKIMTNQRICHFCVFKQQNAFQSLNQKHNGKRSRKFRLLSIKVGNRRVLALRSRWHFRPHSAKPGRLRVQCLQYVPFTVREKREKHRNNVTL